MKKGSKRDKQIIQDIRSGGDRRTQALQILYRDQSIHELIQKVIQEGGGKDSQWQALLKDCIVAIDRQLRLYPNAEGSLMEQFAGLAKAVWGNKLANDEQLRRQAVAFVAQDTDLPNRLKSKITQNGGKNADASDFYQTGIIKLQENLRDGKYRGGAIKGYFLQICFNIWRNSLRAKRSEEMPEDAYEIPGNSYTPQQVLEQKEFNQRWSKAFTKLSERCQELLTLKFFRRTSFNMSEIAERLGYKDAQNASNALLKCKNKLKSILAGMEE